MNGHKDTPVEIAGQVEHRRVEIADEVEITREEMAAILEADRKRHNLRMEERLKERTRVINRRFGFLFGAMFLIFGLLAYRSEVNTRQSDANTRDIVVGFRVACEKRAAAAEQYNNGREALVQLFATAPFIDQTSATKAIIIKQLRDGLLLPVEQCNGEEQP
jgi:hypothetical protein